MKKLILAIAALALVAMPSGSWAEDGRDYYGTDISQSLDVSYDFDYDQEVDVDIDKDLSVDIYADVYVTGAELYYCEWFWCEGVITVDGLASATVKNDQILKWNTVFNEENINSASISGNVLRNATGNIGANVVAGDNNAQDNLAALAAAEMEMSMTDAEIFKTQLSLENFTYNHGSTNSASVSGNVLENAEGNIGVNVSAGNNNAQSNMLAVTVAPAKVGMASVTVNQEAAGNLTINEPVKVDKVEWLDVELTLEAGFEGGYGGVYCAGCGGLGGTWGSYSGTEKGTTSSTWHGASYSGGVSGSYSGQSDQIGDVYLDTWNPGSQEPPYWHPTDGGTTGHVDVDSMAQGAQDLNDDGGAFAFNEWGDFSGKESGSISGHEHGTYSGTESGTYSGGEIGLQVGALGGSILGSVYGSIPIVTKRVVAVTNTASLSGNVLQNAVGNIGVNVAAGTGNLQANALAISYIPEASTPAPTPVPGE